jgi:small-conductance mechanosensitive channel
MAAMPWTSHRRKFAHLRHKGLRVISLCLGLILCLGMLLTSQKPVGAVDGVSAALAKEAQAQKVDQKQSCAETPSFVTLDDQKVVELRRAPAAQNLEAYVRRAEGRLLQLARNYSIQPSQLVVQEDPPFSVIGILARDGHLAPEMAVDDRAAACFGLTRQSLAIRYRDQLRKAINDYRSRRTLSSWLNGTALAALVLGIYILWLRGQVMLNERMRRRIDQRPRFILQQLGRLGLSGFVDVDQVRALTQLLRQVIHWSVVMLISYLLIPLLLGLFPPTQSIAAGLRGQIRDLVIGFLSGVVQAIPNLLSILVILVITLLVIRASNAWFQALDHGRVRIPGFYQEWALPTARLATILLTLIGLAVAFPYIPGSGSKVFQGAGLFVGVLAALGSSAIATNVISGLMLIYTRAFREGDRVEINGVVGVVQDRALLVTRLKTTRNELVSIPNASVIGASVVNYSFSRREIQQPVALMTTITIGYDVPWRQVQALMLNAARSVPGITDEIEPFVLQTSLNDFHISYELNAFVRDPALYPQTLSEVLAALQDQFAAADVEILSPGYHAIRDGNPRTVPPAPDSGSLPQQR